MPKPTKFDLMRQNRYAAELMGARRDASAAREWIAAAMEVPATKFMEIDGVRYAETPDLGGGCSDCAFDSSCRPRIRDMARSAFGGGCVARGVVYVKAWHHSPAHSDAMTLHSSSSAALCFAICANSRARNARSAAREGSGGEVFSMPIIFCGTH